MKSSLPIKKIKTLTSKLYVINYNSPKQKKIKISNRKLKL